MWLAFAFLSATLLGFYDVCKKHALGTNAVIPVLFLNTLFCSMIFVPLLPQAPFGGWEVQRFIVLKSCIVLSSWALGYCGIKHLPITLVGPINATRPVMVLLGALIIFGERLNAYQWAGVLLAVASFFMLSRSGKREGIDFRHNRWIYCIVGAAILGAVSGLYDKYLMASAQNGGAGLAPLTVQMLVQLLPGCHDGLRATVLLVAPTPLPDSLQVEVEHPAHQYLPQRSRLCLFLCPQHGRFAGECGEHGEARQRAGELPGGSVRVP